MMMSLLQEQHDIQQARTSWTQKNGSETINIYSSKYKMPSIVA